MPSSTHSHLTAITGEILNAQPRTVLDIGVGFGKWGHLAREYTDIWARRYLKEDWQVCIEGVEAFADYVNPATEYYYDTVHIGEAQTVAPTLGRFDMVLAIDVIEHLDKDVGLTLVRRLVEMTDRVAVFSIPLGDAWLGANKSYIEVNGYEAHRASWEAADLPDVNGYRMRAREFDGVRGPIGLFVYDRR